MPYHPLQLANAFIQAGELNDALEALTEHLTTEPEDTEARRLRIDVLIRQRDRQHLETALDDLRQLKDRMPEDVLIESTILERLERSTECLTVLEDGHSRWPEDARLAERTVQALFHRHKYDRAYAVVKPFLALNDWRWLQWAGDIMAAVQNHAAASDHYTAALQMMEQGAEDAITAVHPLAGAYARLLLVRATVYENGNQVDLAHADYARALTLVPDDPVIAFKLGLSLIQQGKTTAGVDQCLIAWKSTQGPLRQELHRLITQLPADHPLLQQGLDE